MASLPAPPVTVSSPAPRVKVSFPPNPLTISVPLEVEIVSDKPPPIKVPVPLIFRNASVSALKSRLALEIALIIRVVPDAASASGYTLDPPSTVISSKSDI